MSNNMNSEYTGSESTTPKGYIVLVWAVALIPLAWGFVNTLMRAAKLFQ